MMNRTSPWSKCCSLSPVSVWLNLAKSSVRALWQKEHASSVIIRNIIA